MTVRIKILPSGHEFAAERNEPVLDAALRGGINLNYRCNNGSCGQCKARLQSGEVRTVKHHDYVLTEAERTAGYTLLCCHSALTDLVLEAAEAREAKDIPYQEIATKVRKIERPSAQTSILHLRTPRSNTLRFLAGQYATLCVTDLEPHRTSVASCPCDNLNLQFHFRNDSDDAFSRHVRSVLKPGDPVTVCGPGGNFTLDEDSPRAMAFVACELGFAAIKSLIEHVLSLDKPQPMRLYWLTHSDERPYLHNFCRSLADALDNFHYRRIKLEAGARGAMTRQVLDDHPDLSSVDVYASGPADFLAAIRTTLQRHGLPARQWHAAPITDNGAIALPDES